MLLRHEPHRTHKNTFLHIKTHKIIILYQFYDISWITIKLKLLIQIIATTITAIQNVTFVTQIIATIITFVTYVTTIVTFVTFNNN
jgi:hypothetical protein